MNKGFTISLLLASNCLLASTAASADPSRPPSILLRATAPSSTIPLPALPEARDMPWLDGWPASRSCEPAKHWPYREDLFTGVTMNGSAGRTTTRGAAS